MRKEKYERERAERIREHEEALRCWEAECEALIQAHRAKLSKYQEDVHWWQVRCEGIRRVHQQKYEEDLRHWESECESLRQTHQERLREHQEALRRWEAECEDLKRIHEEDLRRYQGTTLRQWQEECAVLNQAHQERLREHQEALRQWEAECEDLRRRHEEDLRRYQETDLRRWQEECAILNQAHQERLREHQEALRQWEAECEDLRRKHEERCQEILRRWQEECTFIGRRHWEKYQEALRQWEAECEAIKRKHKDEVVRLSFRQQSLRPNASSDARSGRFDNFLRDVLRKRVKSLERYGFEVTLFPQNAAISIQAQGWSGYYHKGYTPDIAMQVSRNRQSLLIDIEIDEPWFLEGNWRSPIHTINDCKQNRRDTHLADRGWVVIRFSERQVATESEECINLVFYLVLSAFAPDPEQLNLSFSFPTDHKRWDSQSAPSEPRFPLPYSSFQFPS